MDETCTQEDIRRHPGPLENWKEENPGIYVYIDDANSVEKIRVPGSTVSISAQKQKTKVHAEKSQEIMNTVALRAANIGMKVNSKKNSIVMCVTQY